MMNAAATKSASPLSLASVVSLVRSQADEKIAALKDRAAQAMADLARRAAGGDIGIPEATIALIRAQEYARGYEDGVNERLAMIAAFAEQTK